MEFKETKNYYLHPDFDDIGVDNEKKPSPLALLLQTCKNVGSIKGSKDSCVFNQTFSPTSTAATLKEVSKRSRSISSSNSSMTDRDYLSPTKRVKIDNKSSKRKRSSIIELKHADTSSETSFHSKSSLIHNFLQFVKNSNSIELTGNDKMDLIELLAGQYSGHEKAVDIINTSICKSQANHFNVEKGYHLESPVESSILSDHKHGLMSSSYLLADKSTPPDNCQETLDLTKSKSTIKYCMYCGKFIPLLPVLLAHIRFEHGNTNIVEPASTMTDVLSRFNPFVISNETNPNQTFSLITDYLSSSFQARNNLIC